MHCPLCRPWGQRGSIWGRSKTVRPGCSFGRRHVPNIRKAKCVTDAERLHDIEQKSRLLGNLSHYADAERDAAWLLDHLAERDARVAELEARSNPIAFERSHEAHTEVRQRDFLLVAVNFRASCSFRVPYVPMQSPRAADLLPHHHVLRGQAA